MTNKIKIIFFLEKKRNKLNKSNYEKKKLTTGGTWRTDAGSFDCDREPNKLWLLTPLLALWLASARLRCFSKSKAACKYWIFLFNCATTWTETLPFCGRSFKESNNRSSPRPGRRAAGDWSVGLALLLLMRTDDSECCEGEEDEITALLSSANVFF